MIRKVSGLIQGRYTYDGAGVKLYRVFGGTSTYHLTDPFLLLDFFGSSNVEDYINGFPWHPHRGIETVTYLIQGKVEHEDSEGNKGVIYPGEAQWMTAGSGIFHQEMPKPLDEKDILHTPILTTENKGLQLWINLPASKKMTSPVYRDVRKIPKVKIDKGEIQILSGQFMGVDGVVNAGKDVDPTYLDVKLEEEGEFHHVVHPKYTVLAFIIEGSVDFPVKVSEGNLLIFDEGDEVVIKSRKGVRLILLSGKPLREEIAWYGPIVMNTEEQIVEALNDLRRGTFVRDTKPEKITF
ncbi:pirin family protein [Acidianus sp. HS-5]|uniref:pirin family protein n=1 Tax=Acidianus sp. HS-5 TaxID=2886040 RepID=UPI001F1B5BD2|nr:pirin family protein [Acidianus sp. HS-5]BDC18693.1 hypothetical protein HS5_15830 [Acidianus sp. HS-5]